MRVYRIVQARHAGDLSGMGAAQYPGRWNKKGTPVLYTGTTIEIALLEVVVNLPPMLHPSLELVALNIPDDSIGALETKDLPQHWHRFPAPSVLADLGQHWVDEGRYLALQVPSSVVPSAVNIVLNCRHSRFAEVKMESRKPFPLDPRLLKA